MLIEKFSQYTNKDSQFKETIIDSLASIINSIDKNIKFKFASSSVFCFGKENVSYLIFEENSHTTIQKQLSKNKLKSIGGYNIYKIDKDLENPFFNNNNQYLESCFYFRDNNYFKKIKYFISKILSISDELNHYPSIKWDSNRIVEIKIHTHKTGNVTDNDKILAERISELWYNLLDI